MAQSTQKKTGVCNTKIQTPSAAKARNWTFTLNNYTRVHIDNLLTLDCLYVFQEETGEKGTPHLQGLLVFKNAVSFNSVKRLIPTAHIEKCKNKNASIRYCSKEDSRTGGIYTNMTDKTYFGTTDTGILSTTEDFKVRLKKSGKDFMKNFDEECDDYFWHDLLHGGGMLCHPKCPMYVVR